MFEIYVFVLFVWWFNAAFDLAKDRDFFAFLIICAFGFIWPIIIVKIVCKWIGKLLEGKDV